MRSSGEAEAYAFHRAVAGALQTQHISTGWGRPVQATVRSDGTAAIGISPRSGACKLRQLGVKELWIQELVQARKLVIKKVGTDDNPADVGTKYIDVGKKLVHLFNLSGLRMKRSLELTALIVATVALQGCASIVHVEGAVTGSTAAVTVRVSLEMVIAVCTGSLVWWLVARARVGKERTPKENNDEGTPHYRLQQETPCSHGDHGYWRRAGHWKSCGGIEETIGERNCSSVVVE